MKGFGLVARQLRQSVGHTNESLARVVGCDVRTVDAVELSIKPIPGKFLVAWADAVRIQPEMLVYLYLNEQAKRMCVEAGVTPLFKLVPATTEDLDGYGRSHEQDARRNF